MQKFQETLREFIDLSEFHSLNDFAKAVGISRSSISKWLADQTLPSPESAIKLADFFHCSLDYLFGLSDKTDYKKGSSRSGFLERFTLLSAKSGITDYTISKHCKISSGTVAKWRYHGNLPQIPKLIRLAELFGCSLDYLVGRSDNL